MELDLITTALIAAAPAISTILTVVGGIIFTHRNAKRIKDDNRQTVSRSTQRMERIERKINVLTAKLSSIEQYLSDGDGRR